MTFYTSGNAAGGREMLVEALRWMTVYESSNAITPRDRLRRVVGRNGDLLGNSGALMATSILTSVVGFAYWWVAARAFPADAIGVASAAISAMTLIGTLGMFGMNTLLISELPKAGNRQWSLISTCVTVAAIVSTIGGVIYVVVAPLVSHGLRESLDSPVSVCLLILASGLNGAVLVLDEGMIGLLAGHLQLLRNAYFAVGKLIFVGVLVALPFAGTGNGLLATWTAGMLLSVVLIALPLRSRSAGSPVRPRLSAMRGLARQAMDHNLLNLALFVPGICRPMVVASVVSTSATAAYYTASMFTSVLGMLPASIATTLFAVASGDRATLRAKVRVGLVIAFGLGMPVSLGVALLGRPLMSLFGKDYANTAGVALSLLALTYFSTAVKLFYVAIARVRQRIRHATFLAIAFGLVELAAAWEGGRRGGLIGLVIWLTVTLTAEGVVLAPSVLRVALTRVAAAPTAPDGAGPGSPAVTDTRPATVPRREPGRPRLDETVVFPLPQPDQTVIIPRLRTDDTVVLSLRELEAWIHDTRVPDETMEIPRVTDEPVGRAEANGTTADRPTADESTVDDLAVTAVIPRIAAEAQPPSHPHEPRPAAGVQPAHGGDT